MVALTRLTKISGNRCKRKAMLLRTFAVKGRRAELEDAASKIGFVW